MRAQLKLKMKAPIRTVLWFTCIALMLFSETSCRLLGGGIAVQDGDCIPAQELTNLKLIMAAVEGNLETMSAMIKAGADVNTSDEAFGTPMVAAVYSGNVDAVRLLLDKGANPNATSETGCSALIVGALLHKGEVVRLLVSRGADVNASCYPLANGKRLGKLTVLTAAKDNEAMVRLLRDAGAKE